MVCECSNLEHYSIEEELGIFKFELLIIDSFHCNLVIEYAMLVAWIFELYWNFVTSRLVYYFILLKC